MMFEKDLVNYENARQLFLNECFRVCREMGRYDKIFNCFEEFELCGDTIKCKGRHWYTSDNYDVYTKNFPVEWLEMKNEKFKKYVDDLIETEEKEQRIEEEKRIREDTKKALTEFCRLRQKYKF